MIYALLEYSFIGHILSAEIIFSLTIDCNHTAAVIIKDALEIHFDSLSVLLR